jgi:hypothetical protein
MPVHTSPVTQWRPSPRPGKDKNERQIARSRNAGCKALTTKPWMQDSDDEIAGYKNFGYYNGAPAF